MASLVGGTGSGAGDVTRYPVVDTTLATVWRTRAEASQKLAGETTYSHDGYVPVGYADATAQATVHQDRLTTIATLGAFAFCDATGNASGFVRYRASVAAVGASTGMQAGASLTKSGSVASAAGASGSSTGVRSVLPQATHASGCDAYPLIGLVRHAGAVSVSCDAIALPVVGKRTAYVTARATAGGELSAFIVTGNQYKAFASGLCAGIGWCYCHFPQARATARRRGCGASQCNLIPNLVCNTALLACHRSNCKCLGR